MSGKLEKWQLKQRQGLSLEDKIKKSVNVVGNFLMENKGYVSFSGGIDSTVMLEIVRRAEKVFGLERTPVVFCNTGVEYPSIVKFVYESMISGFGKRSSSVSSVTIERYGFKETFYRDKGFVVIYPKWSFKEIVEKWGYPVANKDQAQRIGRAQRAMDKRGVSVPEVPDVSLKGKSFWIKQNCPALWAVGEEFGVSQKWRGLLGADFKISGKCCDVIKKAPFVRYEKHTGRKAIVGVKASDSRLRERAYLEGGCVRGDKRTICTPLGFWRDEDVREYTKRFSVDVAEIYEKHYSVSLVSSGCRFCAFENNLPKIERADFNEHVLNYLRY